MRRFSSALLLAAVVLAVLAVTGSPLPPLWSRIGGFVPLEETQRQLQAWSTAGGFIRYAYSTWIWAAGAVALSSGGVLARHAPVVRHLLEVRPIAARILTPLAVLVPALLVCSVPPLVLAASGLPQSNYLRQDWPLSDVIVYAAVPWIITLMAFGTYATGIPAAVRASGSRWMR